MRKYATLTGALATLLCALAGLLLSPQPLATAAGPCAVADASNDGEELAFLAVINSHRANSGAGPLSLSPALNRAAEWMVQDMAANNRFGHTDSLGRSPHMRILDCGYAISGGENLAAGTNRSLAAGAFELFRNSPSHNENMLRAEYRDIGIARVYREGTKYGWYWATTFGSHGGRAPAPPPSPPPPPAPAPPASVVAAPPAPLVLPAGAHQVTWPGPDVDVTAALLGREEQVAAVWTIDAATGEWTFYLPGLPGFLNTLRRVHPGDTLWLVVEGDEPVVLGE
ncbi:MAG: CAP domain-containing protein [Dehalococcoidia bacterium]